MIIISNDVKKHTEIKHLVNIVFVTEHGWQRMTDKGSAYVWILETNTTGV